MSVFYNMYLAIVFVSHPYTLLGFYKLLVVIHQCKLYQTTRFLSHFLDMSPWLSLSGFGLERDLCYKFSSNGWDEQAH